MRRWDRKKQDTENNGKKHRKSRWPACASAAAASFLLCACGGGGAAAADAEDISLYDRGLAVIDIMAEMTESEAYIGLTTANDGIRAIIYRMIWRGSMRSRRRCTLFRFLRSSFGHGGIWRKWRKRVKCHRSFGHFSSIEF